jgi:hypothetical protein
MCNLQVCCQPTFAAAEDTLLQRLSCSCWSGRTEGADSSPVPSNKQHGRRRLWLASLAFRCVYVGFTTLVAVALPFFAVMVGLVAALTFYQTAVLYPVLLHRAVFPPKRVAAVLMDAVLVLAAAVTAMVVIGSVAVIASAASTLSPLKAL